MPRPFGGGALAFVVLEGGAGLDLLGNKPFGFGGRSASLESEEMSIRPGRGLAAGFEGGADLDLLTNDCFGFGRRSASLESEDMSIWRAGRRVFGGDRSLTGAAVDFDFPMGLVAGFGFSSRLRAGARFARTCLGRFTKVYF
jgi:hypothetical protein